MRLKHKGFTLIEVMITIFVVAIGLLAAAGMQAASKKAAFDAIQRSNATALAQEMIERMRANPSQLATYVKNGNRLSAEPASQTCNRTTLCSTSQMVTHDLFQWWQGLNGNAETASNGQTNAGGLRSPTGCIQFPSGTKDLCRVRVAVAWRGLTAQNPDGLASDANDPTNNTCGRDLDIYDDKENSVEKDGRYRRVLVISTNLSQGTTCP